MDNQANGLLPQHMVCSHREEIVARWFFLTREKMPQLAAERRWPVRFDHCFQRILLDNAVAGAWRDVIPAPAYRMLPMRSCLRHLPWANKWCGAKPTLPN